MRRFLTGILIVLVLAGSFGTAGYLFRGWELWIRLYNDAEPLHPIAVEFAEALSERMQRHEPRQVRWSDVAELLAEERFVRLRGRGFVPSAEPGVMITLRANDRHEFPLMEDGTAKFVFRD